MTGILSPAVFAGVHTLRYRQSSLIPAGAPKIFANAASCMQLTANVVACFTPVHDWIGCGAFHRSAPTGGAANGMPLKEAMPLVDVPATRPPVTSASLIWALAIEAHTSTTTTQATTTACFFTTSPLVKRPFSTVAGVYASDHTI